MSTYQKNYTTLMRAAAGDVEARDDAVAILLRGVRTYFENRGELDLARCCGLPSPTARGKFNELERNYWLFMAASHIVADGPTARARALEKELNTFVGRIWPNWKECGPPSDASQLRMCLYRVVSVLPDKLPKWRQIYRVVEVDVIGTQVTLHTKALEMVDLDSCSDWGRSALLQSEFSSRETYLAYRRAEAQGRIRFSDKIPPCNDTD